MYRMVRLWTNQWTWDRGQWLQVDYK